MKKYTLLILIFFTLNAVPMTLSDDTKIVFEEKNLNHLIDENEDSKIYLTHVAIYAPANLNVFWGSEMDEETFAELDIEFSLVYHYFVIGKYSIKEFVAVAYFSKELNHKIYESSFLNNWGVRQSEDHYFVPMSFEAAKGICSYIGNSDNDDLLAVKIWKFVNNRRNM